MTYFIAILACAALIVGAYCLGVADGRLEAEEKHSWERMDELIRRIGRILTP